MIKISVVVTAYNRKEFLKEALASLVAQTLQKEKFEVVLLTNFEYDLSDFGSLSLRHFILDGTVGEYMQKAINEAEGEIICFLDDDDLYDPGKLLALQNNFSEEVVYYKHSVRSFRTGDAPQSMHEKYQGGTLKQISRSDYLHPDVYAYNRTSIALRKSFIEKYSSALKNLDVSEDWFFFLAYITSKGIGIYDCNKLSYYRRHDSVSSKAITKFDKNYQSYVSYLTRLINSFNYMKIVFSDPVSLEILNYQLSAFNIRYLLLSGNKDSTVNRNDLLNLFKASIKNYNEFWLIKFLYIRAFIRAFLPKLSDSAERLYAKVSRMINAN